MKKTILIFLLLSSFFCQGQTFFEKDTVYNKKRTVWLSSAIGVGWAGSMTGLSTVWYKDKFDGKFQFFDDSKEWLGMDKFGHAYTSYTIAKDVTEMYHWAGLSRNSSLLIGSLISLGFQANLEVFDGFADEWGFSWLDMGANTAGIVWFAWQDLVWQDQKIKFKFSSHLTPYANYRPNVLGSNFPERLLKDYNGQTYWLSVAPGSFLADNSKFPKWLSFSVGYSIEEKLHGEKNTYVATYSGGIRNFHAYNQFLFSLDVDFERIEVKKPWLKTLFKALNHVKVPFPALIFTKNGVQAHPFYF